MKITRLETVRLGRYPHSLWLRVHTDEGLTGLGETSYAPRAISALIHDDLAPILLGQSPLDIERLWNGMFAAVNAFGFGGAETRAISDGMLSLPQRPGLGVTLSEGVLHWPDARVEAGSERD